VQEIRGWSAVTPIPEAPHHVLGVQNLRGTIVPIIDLRVRMGMPSMEPSATTVIIVVSIETSDGARLFGIVADRVSDVTNLTEASLRAVPTMGSGGAAEYLRGLLSLGDDMILVLDIDKLLSDGGMTF
jgi:purine-binding chemotaxis protein CheW